VFSLGIGFLQAIHTYVVALVEVLVLCKRKLNVHHVGRNTSSKPVIINGVAVCTRPVLSVTVLGTGGLLSSMVLHVVTNFPVGVLIAVHAVCITGIEVLVISSSIDPCIVANGAVAAVAISRSGVTESGSKLLITNGTYGSLGTGSIGRGVTKCRSLLLATYLTYGSLGTSSFISLMTKSLYENVITKLTGLSSCTGSSRAKLVANGSDGGLCYGDKTAIGALYALGLTLGGASGLNSCNGSKIVTLCCSFVGILVTASTSESNLTLLGTSSLFGNELSVFVNVSRLRLRARCNCKYDCKEHKHASQNGNLSLHDKEPPFLFFISFEIT
jgi:hypothetical protein